MGDSNASALDLQIVELPQPGSELMGKALFNLHDTGELEDALRQREAYHREASRGAMDPQSASERAAWVAARVQQALMERDNPELTAVSTIVSPSFIRPSSVTGVAIPDVDIEASFSQVALHVDPDYERQTLALAEVNIRATETHLVAHRHVALVTDTRVKEAAVSGIRTTADAMAEHQYNSDVQMAGCQALTTLAAKLAGSKNTEAGAAGMRAAVLSLRAFASNSHVVEAACIALGAMAALAESADAPEEGVEAVVGVVHAYRANAAVETHACRALLSLLKDDSKALKRAVSAKAVEATLQALSDQPNFALLQEAGLELINEFAASSKEDRQRAADCGAVSAALRALHRHLGSSLVVAQAFRTLGEMEEAQLRAEAGGDAVEVLVRSLRQYRASAEIQAKGCLALRSFVGTNEGKMRAARAGALDVATVAAFAHAEHREMQEAVAALVKSLAVCKAVRESPTAHAAIEGLVESMKAHMDSGSLVENGCAAICNMIIDQPESKSLLTDIGGPAVIVAAMQQHLMNEEVQEAALAVFWALADSDDCDVVESGGGEAIVRSMAAHISSAAVQNAGCLAICALAECGGPEAEAQLASCGAVETVLDTLRLHGASSKVQLAGLRALHALVDSSANARKFAHDQGAMEIVNAAMTTRFPNNEQVVQTAGEVLQMLQPSAWGLAVGVRATR